MGSGLMGSPRTRPFLLPWRSPWSSGSHCSLSHSQACGRSFPTVQAEASVRAPGESLKEREPVRTALSTHSRPSEGSAATIAWRHANQREKNENHQHRSLRFIPLTVLWGVRSVLGRESGGTVGPHPKPPGKGRLCCAQQVVCAHHLGPRSDLELACDAVLTAGFRGDEEK